MHSKSVLKESRHGTVLQDPFCFSFPISTTIDSGRLWSDAVSLKAVVQLPAVGNWRTDRICI